jgi:TonB family protein
MRRSLLLIIAGSICACAVAAKEPAAEPQTFGARSCDPQAAGALVASGVQADTVMFQSDIGKSLRYADQPSLRYPDELRSRAPEGEARASFVIDTTGRVQTGSAEILAETHRAFGDEVCRFLQRATFMPVAPHGKKLTIRVWSQRFAFTMRSNEEL